MLKRPIIIDSDADFDDFIAITWLNALADIDIKAITYIGCGWSRYPDGFNNLFAFMDAIHLDTDIPIALGALQPLSKHKSTIPPKLLSDSNKLWGVKLPKSTRSLAPQSAHDLIIQTCHQSSQPLTIIAIGPLTNIALALQKDPQIASKIDCIFITGGAPLEEYQVYGPNAAPNHAAGNERIDIHAYKIVCDHAISLYSLLSPAAENLSIDTFLSAYDLKTKTSVIALIHKLLQQVMRCQKDQSNYTEAFLWDVFTVYCFMYQQFEAKQVCFTIDERATDKDFIQEATPTSGYRQCSIHKIDNAPFIKRFYDDILHHYGDS
ncbi:MAG: hypothetical protein COB66_07530 [Coxiella sp. (in: Bacteria)]|nr:MAG: hypothetical protein COB66_07530 [Coxiella sp. (in: g-proteobacteria)]